jgi:glyoxylase-like metal-dependent hydrolase (beta-lactamase superfamily II)
MVTMPLRVERLVVGPLFSNCYIVWDDKLKEGAIIDPGEDAHLTLKRVIEIGLKIKYILATHGHFDHVAAVAPLKRDRSEVPRS